MEAHNSKTRLGTSEVPLVVKFADAKRKEPSPHHVSSPLLPTPIHTSLACHHELDARICILKVYVHGVPVSLHLPAFQLKDVA